MTAPSPQPTRRRPLDRVVGIVALVLAVLLLLAGIGLAGWGIGTFVQNGGLGFAGRNGVPDLPPAEKGPMPRTAPDLSRFYDQKLDWRRCGDDECTELMVPLDYAHPEGETIQLAVIRVPATDRSHRLGQLVTNPGGPGASSIDFAKAGALAVGQVLAKRFDIIGMDPRGVGRSTPVKCEGTAGTDEILAADPDPRTPAEVRRYDALTRELGEACLRRSGDLVRHVSTVEAAKDMDILREALGERRLDYFGGSYGTFLGATYAHLFPTHVRRMVLDGALDPKLSTVQLALGQAHGFETALRAYLASCLSESQCPLSGDVDQAAAQVKQFLQSTEQRSLPTGTSRPLTSGLAYLGIAYPLYAKQLWPELTFALTAAVRQGNGAGLLALADAFTDRTSTGYSDNSNSVIYAVNCLDHDDYVPSSQVPRYFPAFEKASPTFGRIFAWGLAACADWPVKSHHRTTALTAEGAPPIIVIGTTRDPATPYAWAKGLAGELSSARLITRDGDGHTGFNKGNSCVDDAVNRYFLTGTPPPRNLSC